MASLDELFERARHGRGSLWLLNRLLQYKIPFNRPHGIVISEVSAFGLETALPYRRRNFNHIRGLHACALATLAEFTAGLVLLRTLGSADYRLIMQALEMSYVYQGKCDARARFALEEHRIRAEVLEPLQTEDTAVIHCEVPVVDRADNHLCTGITHWQVKPWSRVRTRR